MTGYTVHTGTSVKFTAGWDRIFVDTAAAKPEKKDGGSSKKSVSRKQRKTDKADKPVPRKKPVATSNAASPGAEKKHAGKKAAKKSAAPAVHKTARKKKSL